MKKEDIETLLNESLCCIANKSNELSDLFSKGNKCSNQELEKLNLIINKIKVLNSYYSSLENSEEVIDNLGLKLQDITKMNYEISNYCNFCEHC